MGAEEACLSDKYWREEGVKGMDEIKPSFRPSGQHETKPIINKKKIEKRKKEKKAGKIRCPVSGLSCFKGDGWVGE